MPVDPSTKPEQRDQLPDIPGYTLRKLIGSGAMAAVYLAIQDSLQRRVALKIMSSSLAADSTFCKRFLKEGKIIGKLNHPHIITIYDIGEYQGRYYMAMEYVGGGTLKERIKAPIPAARAVSILCEIAGALGYAHSRGFVHRDVKPANILFRTDETSVLSDFGIAKSFNDGSTQMTAAGWTLGTPNYMSPEQALGRPVDARSDLYALGIVFYEMLLGKRPYEAKDAIATALMHVNEPIPRLPAGLAAYQGIIDKLLAKKPDDRFTTAEELVAAVGKMRAAQEAAAVNDVTYIVTLPKEKAARPKVSSPPAKRSKLPYWVAAGVLALLFVIVAYFVLPQLLKLKQRPPVSLGQEQLSTPPWSSPDAWTQGQIVGYLPTAVDHRLAHLAEKG